MSNTSIGVSMDETPLSKHDSSWLAAWNPNIWRLTRKDQIAVDMVGLDANTIRINLTGTVPSDVNVGDAVFINSNSDGGLSGGFSRITGTIEAKTSTRIDVTAKFSDGTLVSGGYVNYIGSRPSWRLDVQLRDPREITNPLGNVLTSVAFVPDFNGKVVCDMREYIQSEMQLAFHNDYQFSLLSFVNWQDVRQDLSIEFFFQTSYIDPSSNVGARVVSGFIDEQNGGQFWPIRAARQLRDLNSMEDFLLDVDPDTKGSMFLTPKKPPRIFDDVDPDLILQREITHWIGLPWSVSFIYNYDYTAQLRRRIVYVNINGSVIGSDTEDMQSWGLNNEGVNFLGLLGATILPEAYSFSLWIEDNETPFPEFGYWSNAVEPSYGVGGYVVGNV